MKNIQEDELLLINGGSFWGEVGECIGDGLAWAARGLSATNTATQVRWYNENR
ncbi:MAG: hypothetical protein RSD77_09075 [Romboutsia sp.]